jgi:hypothetical protein
MQERRCAGCGKEFRPRAQSPRQRYCAAAACQRARRRRWQAERRRSDPDYHDNQRRAQQRWLEGHRGYWREYRERHPHYVAGNRDAQRSRDRRRRGGASGVLAKSDASTPPAPLGSGTYQLVPVLVPGLAKMDAWMVEIAFLSGGYPLTEEACKERTS